MTSGRVEGRHAHPGLLRARVHARRGPRSSDLHFRLDNVWRPLALTEPVRDDVRVGRALYLAPLVPLVGRGEGAVVVVVAASAGSSTCCGAGGSRRSPTTRRSSRGSTTRAVGRSHGFSDTSRRSCTTISRRSRKSSTALSGACTGHRSSSSPRRSAPTSTTSFPRTAAAIVGWTHAEAHAQAPELLGLATPVLERWRAEQEQADRALARGSGPKRTSCGGLGRRSRPPRTAASTSSSSRTGRRHSAARCPRCGRVALEDGSAHSTERAWSLTTSGLDLAVHQTLIHGGSVWAVQHRQDLEPVEGIGALRYRRRP